ncbi:hypothetical protein [Hyphomonas sp.]|uniref:hypothetical protein n=1 Tax=Hyphomonas sp. TaxID=87 RepID=UPI00391875C2
MAVRPQYHFRTSKDGLLAWDVRRLIALSRGLPVKAVALSDIQEVDENHWYGFEGQVPTCRSILAHIALIEQADLSFPILLDAEGRLMDGMHRVCKAIRRGDTHIQAIRFPETPPPDFTGRRPEDLSYD